MDEDRINEIGKKLDITSSDVKNSTLYKFRMLPFFIAGQIGLFLLSVAHSSYLYPKGGNYPTYPGFYKFECLMAAVFVLPFHAVNGVYCFKKEELFGLSQRIRKNIFIITLIVSLASFFLLVNSYPPDSSTVYTMYGVFDKNDYSQKKGISKAN